MRVGVYVDGYNLYYGARGCCGRGTPGWRWIDVRGLIGSAIAMQAQWANPSLSQVVYCTARVDAKTNPTAHAEQDVYLKALVATGSVDHIEYGRYVARPKTALLATDPHMNPPQVMTSNWPVMVQDSSGVPVRNARFMVSYLHLEEKGSDVNLASHLLLDVISGSIDAAIVVSNDSDLSFPLAEARKRVPVGTINPSGTRTAGALKGRKTDGVGNHWWWLLQKRAYYANQLPDPAGRYTKPHGW